VLCNDLDTPVTRRSIARWYGPISPRLISRGNTDALSDDLIVDAESFAEPGIWSDNEGDGLASIDAPAPRQPAPLRKRRGEDVIHPYRTR
jgi:hypothetical protein